LCKDTLGEDEEGQDEEGQGEYSCQNRTDAVCPFTLSLFYWEISKGVYIIFEHLSSVINFIWFIFYVCPGYQYSIQIINESIIIYLIHFCLIGCLIGNKVVDKYKEYQYLSDIE
jgi:hypothetical protein